EGRRSGPRGGTVRREGRGQPGVRPRSGGRGGQAAAAARAALRHQGGGRGGRGGNGGEEPCRSACRVNADDPASETSAADRRHGTKGRRRSAGRRRRQGS